MFDSVKMSVMNLINCNIKNDGHSHLSERSWAATDTTILAIAAKAVVKPEFLSLNEIKIV